MKGKLWESSYPAMGNLLSKCSRGAAHTIPVRRTRKANDGVLSWESSGETDTIASMLQRSTYTSRQWKRARRLCGTSPNCSIEKYTLGASKTILLFAPFLPVASFWPRRWPISMDVRIYRPRSEQSRLRLHPREKLRRLSLDGIDLGSAKKSYSSMMSATTSAPPVP